MDESRHPERVNAQIEISNDQRSPIEGDGAETNVTTASNASSNTLTSTKRAFETYDDTNNANNPAKRANTEHDRTNADLNGDEEHADASNTSPDDLDLDVLMAQLQQHTDKVTSVNASAGDHPEIAHKEGEHTEEREEGVEPTDSHDLQLNVDSIENVINGLQSHNENRETGDNRENTENASGTASIPDQALDSSDSGDPELSIEQQLKGALSSLEFDGNNMEIGLDQLSQLLTGGDPEATRDYETDTTRQGDTPSAETGHESESSGSGYDKTAVPKDKSRRNSLISKMPPPPAHLHGKLPPMPPPPPAFTSPIASSLPAAPESPSITEVSSTHLPASAHITASRSDMASPSTQGSSHAKPAHVVASEPPASLSEDYQKSLLEQVEVAQKEQTSENNRGEVTGSGEDTAKEDTQAGGDSASAVTATPLLLNDNKAILNARGRSILLLDSLALQVLETLSCSHYQETLSTVMQPESERGMIYRILLDAFEDVKRVYMKWETTSSRIFPQVKPDESRPFLSYNISGVDPTRDNLTTIQRVNVATFVAALFGSIEIGFWELDEWFIRVFVPESGRLLKQQANIYLDLKTQAYISAVESSDDKEVHKKALDHLFPTDLESKLLYLFGDRIHLAPQEKDFVAKCLRRRDNIQSEDPADLSKKYHWVPFLREVSDYISKNHTTLLPPRKRTVLLPDTDATVSYERSVSHPPAPRSYPAPRRQVSTSYSRSPSMASSGTTNIPPSATPKSASSDAADRAQSPSGGPGGASDDKPRDAPPGASSGSSNAPDDIQVTAVKSPEAPREPGKSEPPSSSEEKDKTSKETDTNTPEPSDSTQSKHQGQKPDIPSEGHPMFPPLPKQVLPPPSMRQQTPASPPKPPPSSEAPIPVQDGVNTLAAYEAAKASAEGTDAVRPKASMFTTRRTWTKQEEEALLKGMDKVQGPYWSQILELYGPGGKISEVLKDRTQVQLKDKARNLKMFFVRLGLPIPAVFQYVTGDYESRKSSGKRLRRMRSQYDLLQSSPQLIDSEATLQRSETRPSSSTEIRSTETSNPAIHGESTSNSFESAQASPNNTTQRDTNQHSEVRISGSPSGKDTENEKRDDSQHKESLNYDENSTERDHLSESHGDRGHKETDLSDILEDPNDRDDLNTLLNRVGEYVDNH